MEKPIILAVDDDQIVLKLSRTIADLAGEKNIAPNHLAEALQYRPKLTIG